MKYLHLILILFVFSLPCAAAASDRCGEIPGQVTMEHWCCKEVAALSEKYGAQKRLPYAVVQEGKTCSKSELADCLASVMEKLVEKHENEGAEAVSGEDIESVSALRAALLAELSKNDTYLKRREVIESMLAKPEEPPFLIRAGVAGFARAEASGGLSLRDNGYTPGHGEGRLLYRVMPYAYWHPFDWLDAHVEGQAYGFTGHGPDFNRIGLYQGFVEGKLPGLDLLALKLGRQEFVYGSAFILGANSFYEGLTFDAARLRVKPAGALTVDLLGGYYSHPADNGFTGWLAGGYATYQFTEDNSLDAYVLVDSGPVGDVSGAHLDTFGLRGAARVGPASVEFEPVYQTGRLVDPATGEKESISAYGGHLDLALEANTFGFDSTFVAGYALGSGSGEAAEGGSARREFMNPNNDSSLVGDMGFVGDLSGLTAGNSRASGLHDFTLGWGMDLTDKLNLTATGHYLRAMKVPDGFSRNVGIEADFTLTYAFNDDLSLIVGYDRFFTGGFFKDATGSGRDMDYGYATLQFNLAGTRSKRL